MVDSDSQSPVRFWNRATSCHVDVKQPWLNSGGMAQIYFYSFFPILFRGLKMVYDDMLNLSEGDILQIKKNLRALKSIKDDIGTYRLSPDEKQTLLYKIITAMVLTKRIEEFNKRMNRTEYSVLMNLIGVLVDDVNSALKNVKTVE